jgi:hypothetical protein
LRAVDEPLSATRARALEPSAVGEATHGIDADAEDLRGLAEAVGGHAMFLLALDSVSQGSIGAYLARAAADAANGRGAVASAAAHASTPAART